VRNIEVQLLTPNAYSRPGYKLKDMLGIVYHWTGVPLQPITAVRTYFETRKDGLNGYGSAHYLIDVDGSIMMVIPTNEVAYHVGSETPDPKSGKIYTDWAREKFGYFAKNPDITSPNHCSIGIEMVPVDIDGKMSTETIGAARDLGVMLLKQFNLSVEDIGTHHLVIGYNGTSHQDCPRWWTNHPDDFEQFKDSVQRQLLKGSV